MKFVKSENLNKSVISYQVSDNYNRALRKIKLKRLKENKPLTKEDIEFIKHLSVSDISGDNIQTKLSAYELKEFNLDLKVNLNLLNQENINENLDNYYQKFLREDFLKNLSKISEFKSYINENISINVKSENFNSILMDLLRPKTEDLNINLYIHPENMKFFYKLNNSNVNIIESPIFSKNKAFITNPITISFIMANIANISSPYHIIKIKYIFDYINMRFINFDLEF